MNGPLDELLGRLAHDDPYYRVVERIHEGRRDMVVVHAPGDLVPPVRIALPVDTMKAQLAGFIALRDQETRMRKVPEASRRREARQHAGWRRRKREGDMP